ncbi:MAG: putative membrane protein YhdT [Desulforhopalus sp.]|jgi:uncharacterized membrane protein YhdT
MKNPGTFVSDVRFKQANREALLAVGLAVLNFLWWYITAYGFGSKPPENYTYVFGLPLWFMLSCVGGLVLFSLFAWLMVRLFFREMTLDAYLPEKEEEGQR